MMASAIVSVRLRLAAGGQVRVAELNQKFQQN